MRDKLLLFFLRIGALICFIMLNKSVWRYLEHSCHLEDTFFTMLLSLAITIILLIVFGIWADAENINNKK
jgi:amino acid permease